MTASAATTRATTATTVLHEIDARGHHELDGEAVAAFRRDGVIVIRNLVEPDELEVLRTETSTLVEEAVDRAAAIAARPTGWDQHVDEHDLAYRVHRTTGRLVPFRQEYVIARSAACRRLLGHPFVVRSMQRMIGADVTPTWDSMVFKAAGRGAEIPWHRDDEFDPATRRAPVTNVDVYLDGSDESNGLWAIPGSHQWTRERAAVETARRNDATGFVADAAVVLPLRPGDALLHDIGVLHGSPAAESWLRRVLYFEFRSAPDIVGRTHDAAYCVAKQRMLHRVIAERAAHTGEPAAPYAPTWPEPLDAAAAERATGWRFPHEDYPPSVA
jgi:ectoine hydroxylase-related dioxygenase (phytanoyl-CoA dioxygenase family)